MRRTCDEPRDIIRTTTAPLHRRTSTEETFQPLGNVTICLFVDAIQSTNWICFGSPKFHTMELMQWCKQWSNNAVFHFKTRFHLASPTTQVHNLFAQHLNLKSRHLQTQPRVERLILIFVETSTFSILP